MYIFHSKHISEIFCDKATGISEAMTSDTQKGATDGQTDVEVEMVIQMQLNLLSNRCVAPLNANECYDCFLT